MRKTISLFVLLILTYLSTELFGQFTYNDFSSTNGLSLVMNASQFNNLIRLTPNTNMRRGALWYTIKQNILNGFETIFQFQFTGQGGNAPAGADGIAFVIQNVSESTIGASSGGYLAYTGIVNSLAIEFDTYPNGEFGDPNGNHISIQTRGELANSNHHNYSLGTVTTIPNLKNQSVYTAKIIYGGGFLKIYLNDLNNPVLTISINLATTLNLDNGKAWIGFTSSTGNSYENHDLISWSFQSTIPIIFIPGIMGSPLYDDVEPNNSYLTENERIWLDKTKFGWPPRNNNAFLDVLQLNQFGNEPLEPSYNIKTAPLRNDPPTNYEYQYSNFRYPFAIYKDFFTGLINSSNHYILDDCDNNNNEGENLYCFTYDWRKSMIFNADSLSEFIDSVRNWTSSTKVNLIAHSMGGLIAKECIKEDGSDRINKLIFIGTPHLGSPKILYTLLTGDLKFDYIHWLFNKSQIQKISLNMPSAYLLFPTQNYRNINLYNGVTHNGIGYYNFCFYKNKYVPLNYLQTQEYFKQAALPDNKVFNSYLLDQADYFQMHSLEVDYGQIEVYNIVGCNIPTIGEVKDVLKDQSIHTPEINFNLVGDGTVPLKSAEIISYTKRKADYYIQNVKHNDLPSDNQVISNILNLLKEPAITNFNDPPNSYTTSTIQITAGSPVELHSYDSQNRHTGPISDSTWITDIPGSYYVANNLEDTTSAKVILLPPGDTYIIKLISQSANSNFNLSMIDIVEGKSRIESQYTGVPILPATIASCSFDSLVGNIGLNLDWEGDGTVDSTIYPNINNYCSTSSVEQGWNMISLPYLTEQNLKAELFPTATSNAFWFNDGYVVCDTLGPRKGYWLKFDEPLNKISCGQKLEDTIHIDAGWNMIGCINDNIPIGSIDTEPAGILNSNFFGYSGGYSVADTLRTGKGYWIKSNSSGIINFNQSVNKIRDNKITINENWGSITVIDNSSRQATLYFSEEVSTGNYQMPPLPPAGAFDMRFDSGTMVEDLSKGNKAINIVGADYPIRIKIRGTNIFLRDRVNGGLLNISVNDGEEIVIYDSRINKILIGGENQIISVIEYNLEQNYPNPFNPNTLIKFSITNEDLVNLSVFNILGEKVKELKNEMMKPGYYEIEFNASNLASGVYMYKLNAGDFVETKKMILLK